MGLIEVTLRTENEKLKQRVRELEDFLKDVQRIIGRALEDVMQEKTVAEKRVRELEEENRKLREVYNSAKRLINNCVCDRDECENTCANCSFYLLEQALAALDGGGKPQTVIVDEDDGYPDQKEDIYAQTRNPKASWRPEGHLS